MWAAIVRIREWPVEIEADLQHYYRLNISNWHVGSLSSRRLLALLEGLPDGSNYKREFERSGGWPVWMMMLKTVANETSLHRASLYAGGDNAYDAKIFVDPIEIRQQIEEQQAEEEFREETKQKLYSQLGWT